VETVGSLLAEATGRLRAAGSESARLDAELLLGHVLGLERTSVMAHPDARVGDGQAASVRALVERRAAGEPVAYIRGLKEFYGLAFAVDPRALIPRPETELLVDLAVDWLRELLVAAPRPAGTPPLRAWDVGTGCGAIAVAVAVTLRAGGYLRDVRLVASDISRDALALALENVVAHGVADRIDLAVGDLTAVDPAPGRVELVVANLPYIPTEVVSRLPVAGSFEPAIALDGGPDGLAVIRRLLPALATSLLPRGRALLEIGEEQVDAAMEAVATALPGARAAVHADLTGRPRALQVDLPGEVP
jgi:release factor glutamine methyltransferase